VAEVNKAVKRRMDELIEETLGEFGPRGAETKIDTIFVRLRDEFRLGGGTAVWDEVLVAVAHRVGVYMTVPATPEAVARARDTRRPMPRWKMLAVMVKGDPSAAAVSEVRDLYERARCAGAATRSWTGRGRPPSGYGGPTKGASLA
jgi:hypothetical protein